MSHGYGQVRFEDGLVLHFEYNGTADIVYPALWDSMREVTEHWRAADVDFSYCGCAGESVEACSTYNGCHWEATACREHRRYVEPRMACDLDVDPFKCGLPAWADFREPESDSGN